MENKIEYFQYILFKILEGENKKNNLGILKSLSLLFFVSILKTNKNNENSLIGNIFDNFWAMPYGNIEIDIHNEIKLTDGNLKFIIINQDETLIKEKVFKESFSNLDKVFLKEIDDSIDYLKKKEILIFDLNSFDLVELNHQYYSWRKNYNKAIENGKRSEKIPLEDMKCESKIFTLFKF